MKEELRKVGYARVSKATDDKISIANQINKIKEKGVKEKDIFIDDGKSGGLDNDNPKDIKITIEDKWFIVKFNIAKRPAFQKMLLEAKQGLFNELYIYQWSRFSRFAPFQDLVFNHLKNIGIEVIPTDDTEDPLGRKILGTIDEKQREDVRDKINDIKAHKHSLGLYSSSVRKFGYKWIKLNITRHKYKNLELDPTKKDEIELVKTIKANEYSNKLCKQLGINPQTFYNIKKDRFYEGYITLKGDTKKGVHKAIIS